MSKLIIVGAGGFGRETAALVEEINKVSQTWRLTGFVDDDPELAGRSLVGYRVLGDTASVLEAEERPHFVVAIANPAARREIAGKFDAAGFPAASLIHPGVVVHRSNVIHHGSIVCRGTMLTVNTTIGPHAIINLNCTIGHDAVLSAWATVHPGVHISGGITIGEGVEIGTGAVLLPGVSIGKETKIGAGAVVIRDLPSGCTAVGVPARVLEREG